MAKKIVTVEEMNARTARFKKLDSYQKQHSETGLPQEAMEKVAAGKVYPVMVPETYQGRSKGAPLKGVPGLAVSIAECPPGNGPGLHNHANTIENFFCLNGRFEISWGDNGEDKIFLDPLDMVSVPSGIHRRFRNVSDETARLLVMIQIPTERQEDNVTFAASLGAEIEKKHGADALKKLNEIGFKFEPA
jgi:uncharacterized RmlC-like cupin family protein